MVSLYILTAPAHLSFNTYFNSFYESYWTDHTVLEEISLRVNGEGAFLVQHLP